MRTGGTPILGNLHKSRAEWVCKLRTRGRTIKQVFLAKRKWVKTIWCRSYGVALEVRTIGLGETSCWRCWWVSMSFRTPSEPSIRDDFWSEATGSTAHGRERLLVLWLFVATTVHLLIDPNLPDSVAAWQEPWTGSSNGSAVWPWLLQIHKIIHPVCLCIYIYLHYYHYIYIYIYIRVCVCYFFWYFPRYGVSKEMTHNDLSTHV